MLDRDAMILGDFQSASKTDPAVDATTTCKSVKHLRIPQRRAVVVANTQSRERLIGIVFFNCDMSLCGRLFPLLSVLFWSSYRIGSGA